MRSTVGPGGGLALNVSNVGRLTFPLDGPYRGRYSDGMDSELRQAQQEIREALAILQRAERKRALAILQAIDDEGRTQHQVAAILGVKQPTVARIVTKSRARAAVTAEPMTTHGGTREQQRKS